MSLTRAFINRPNFRASIRRNFSAVIEIGGADAFEKISKSTGKKIYYFTASWCPPCRAIAPVFKTLSDAHKSISFVKIDIDANPEVAESFNIRSVPTFIYFNGQNKLAEHAGASEPTLKSNIALLEKS